MRTGRYLESIEETPHRFAGLARNVGVSGVQVVGHDCGQAWAALEAQQNAINVFREKRAKRAALAAAEGPFLMLSW